MKTIGLLGGMSWESTVHYYQIINEEVKNKLGGLHSAKIILYSVEFAEIENYQSSNQWEKCGEILGRAAKKLEDAGVTFTELTDQERAQWKEASLSFYEKGSQFGWSDGLYDTVKAAIQ